MKTVDFKTAFTFPFNRAKGLWNILWILLPIFGWLALFGFQVRIVNGFLKGKFKKLPLFSFKKDMKLGFWMFLKAIPFFLALMVVFILIGAAFDEFAPLFTIFIGMFFLPVLVVNFYKKQTVDSFFDVTKIKYVFRFFPDYLIAILKAIGLAAVFLVMILILVGFPAGAFTKHLFIADFYRRRVK